MATWLLAPPASADRPPHLTCDRDVPVAANLPIWKRESGQEWLKHAPSHTLQQALKDLEKAYKNYFAKRADFPRFKRKGSGDSFRYPTRNRANSIRSTVGCSGRNLAGCVIAIAARCLESLRNVTVSESGGKWFASIQTPREMALPLPDRDKCHKCHWHRCGYCAFRHHERRELYRATQQLQEASGALGEVSTPHEPKGQIRQ